MKSSCPRRQQERRIPNNVERDLLHGGRETELRVVMALRALGCSAAMTLERGVDIVFRPYSREARMIFGRGQQTGEVKWDKAAMRTGNIYVETACYDKPSGISTVNAATWWFYRIGESLYVINIDHLRMMALPSFGAAGGDDSASRGVLIPVRTFVASVFTKALI